MAITPIYSKRNKPFPTELIYDSLPKELRIQIIQIATDAIGKIMDTTRTLNGIRFGHENNMAVLQRYTSVELKICREYGLKELIWRADNSKQAVEAVIEIESDIGKLLSVIELLFREIDTTCRDVMYQQIAKCSIVETPDSTIGELNHRFNEHGVGYQFESGHIIRIDSRLIYNEAILPALDLLKHPLFLGANQEYLKAHQDYRHKNYKGCISESLKAFESTMKIVCHQKQWPYSQKDTASKLVKTILDNGLILSLTDPLAIDQLNALSASLTNGLPPIRNSFGGHGQGAVVVEPTEQLARYALNLSASNILLIVESSGIK